MAGSIVNPQSLNRYSYSINDPDDLTDPSGLCPGGIAREHYATPTQETASGGGPSAKVLEEEYGADPQFQSGCPGFTPQGGEGGGVSIDGGEISSGADSGLGPGGGGFPVGGGEPGGVIIPIYGYSWQTETDGPSDDQFTTGEWTYGLLGFSFLNGLPGGDPNPSNGGSGIGLAKKLLAAIAAGNFESKEKCKDFLAALIKQNNLNISVEELMKQITSTAKDAAHYIYDGPSSTVPITQDAFPGYTQQTVGAYFQEDNGHEALSQFNGSAIYIRVDNWDHGIFGSPYDGPYGSGTMMHETLHKRSVAGGFTHPQMEQALVSIGLNPGGDRQLYHDVTGISDALARICF